jgi:hypothetical protein
MAARHVEAGVSSAGHATGGPKDYEDIVAADRTRYRAMLDGDTDTLVAMLGDGLVYVHSTGAVESKAAYLKTLASLRYRSAEVTDSTVEQFGDVGVMRGRVEIEVEVSGTPKLLRSVFVGVWVLREGAWKLVHWQATPTTTAR